MNPKAIFQGSWKTSLVGIAMLVLMSGPELYAYITAHGMENPRQFWTGLGLFLLGIFARDRNKTSQDDGLPPKILQQTITGELVPVPTQDISGRMIEPDSDRKAEVIILPPK